MRNYFGAMNKPWAISAEAFGMFLAEMQALPMPKAADEGQPAKAANVQGGTMVIPVQGYIVPRANSFLEDWFGLTSVGRVRRQLREAMADPQVARVVFDVDSPGGSVDGVMELASEILAARGAKPMTAVANSLMASAAYWIGSAADEIVVAPSGMVGSIGVIAVHEEVSGALAKDGVAVTIVKAGKFKGEGNPYEPLSEEARNAIQKEVDYFYGAFVAAVAKGRGVKAAEVRNGFGEGRVVNATDALSMGMVDKIATLENVINSTGGGRRRTARADVDLRQRRLRLAGAGSVE